MDRANQEIARAQEANNDAQGERLKELNELELALVGGGSGDPILY